jgi:hypothetical protein
MKLLLAFTLALLLTGILAACSSGGGTTSATTSPPPPTSTITNSTTSTSVVSTFGNYADAGKTLFLAHCAKCHGNNGQGGVGPTLIGSGANLAKYNTSQGLLSFFSTTMPFDAPGSLSSSDYQHLLVFLLVQNNYLSASAQFDPNVLASVQLKK